MPLKFYNAMAIFGSKGISAALNMTTSYESPSIRMLDKPFLSVSE